MTFNGAPNLGPSDSLSYNHKSLALGSAWLGRLELLTISKHFNSHLYYWLKDGKERILNSLSEQLRELRIVSGQLPYLRLRDYFQILLVFFPCGHILGTVGIE